MAVVGVTERDGESAARGRLFDCSFFTWVLRGRDCRTLKFTHGGYNQKNRSTSVTSRAIYCSRLFVYSMCSRSESVIASIDSTWLARREDRQKGPRESRRGAVGRKWGVAGPGAEGAEVGCGEGGSTVHGPSSFSRSLLRAPRETCLSNAVSGGAVRQYMSFSEAAMNL
jgi:hypothetical protein